MTLSKQTWKKDLGLVSLCHSLNQALMDTPENSQDENLLSHSSSKIVFLGEKEIGCFITIIEKRTEEKRCQKCCHLK